MSRHVTRDTDLRLADRAEQTEAFLRTVRSDLHGLRRIEARDAQRSRFSSGRDSVVVTLQWLALFLVVAIVFWLATVGVGPTGNDLPRAEQAQQQRLQEIRDGR